MYFPWVILLHIICIDIPGSFLALKDAFVIARLENEGFWPVGDKATEIPIGPSLGCPLGLTSNEFLMALVTCEEKENNISTVIVKY